MGINGVAAKDATMKKVTAKQALARLNELADPGIAEHSQRFFKTGKGEYGEGDVFLGIRVPVLRKQVPDYRSMSTAQTMKLLASTYHEARLFALLLLVDRFKRGDESDRKTVYQVYLENTRYINNWDLVDLSVYHIVGPYLEKGDTSILDELALSKSLWERRIAIVATFFFIKQGRFEPTLKIAAVLLHDTEDLIHKAVGWMLREVGKRDIAVERKFLVRHYRDMPRTMLRYAIERFPEEERLDFLHGRVS